MDEERKRALYGGLERTGEFALRTPSLNEIGLMRYFCDVIGNRYQELRDIGKIESEMKDLIGDTVSWSTIGRFNSGHPCHLAKSAHITLMDYARALKLKVPDVIKEYYNNLLKEDDEWHEILEAGACS